MSNEPEFPVAPEPDERSIRLPREGSIWKTLVAVALAAAAAAGAITYLNQPKEPGASAFAPPAPSPQETPGVQAPAPAPRMQTPPAAPEPPKVQERVDGGAPPPTAVEPPRTAPFQITPDAQQSGPRQIPLTPRPVQTTPVQGRPPLAEDPNAASGAGIEGNAPTEAPLPKARPKPR